MSGNPNSRKIWLVDSGIRIQLKEFGILLMIGIQNPSSTDRDWNPVPGIWNPRKRIRIQVLSWIPLYGAKILAELVLENYNLEQNKWKTETPPPRQIKDGKMARFCPSRGFILDLGGMGVCCSILFCPRL